MLTEGIDYIYLFPENDKQSVHINLLDGKYKGTTFKYGNVKFEEKDDQGYLLFDYNVIESTGMKPKKLEKDEDFKNFIGNMLIEFISNRLQEEMNENGTADIEESTI